MMSSASTSIPIALACALLVTLPHHAVSAGEFTPAQRQEIENLLHDYLIENPGVLAEATRAAEDKKNREAAAKAKEVLGDRQNEVFDDPATPVGGNPQGDVAIVEFFDYRCPYCKQVEPSLITLLNQDHELRLIYKEMPVLGPQSDVAARAALAAHRQGKFETFHAALMATKGQITDDMVYAIAASAGLDIDALKWDMVAPEIDRALKTNLALAEALNIRGTPGFIIGDHIAPGALDIDTLKKMVADARKR
jgi:protein-disulfide isomerase